MIKQFIKEMFGNDNNNNNNTEETVSCAKRNAIVDLVITKVHTLLKDLGFNTNYLKVNYLTYPSYSNNNVKLQSLSLSIHSDVYAMHKEWWYFNDVNYNTIEDSAHEIADKIFNEQFKDIVLTYAQKEKEILIEREMLVG